jgi:hypothetical protein
MFSVLKHGAFLYNKNAGLFFIQNCPLRRQGADTRLDNPQFLYRTFVGPSFDI